MIEEIKEIAGNKEIETGMKEEATNMITIGFMRLPGQSIGESMVFIVEDGTPKVECWRLPYGVLNGIKEAIAEKRSYEMQPETQIGFIYPSESMRPLLCLGIDCYEVDLMEFDISLRSTVTKSFAAKQVTFPFQETPFVQWSARLILDAMRNHHVRKAIIGSGINKLVIERYFIGGEEE